MGFCGWADVNERNKVYHDTEWVATRPVDVCSATTGAERRNSGT